MSPAREIREKLLLQSLENHKGEPYHTRRKCQIAWAFIREDAWQAALSLGGPNYTGWGNSPTVETEKAKLQKSFERAKLMVSLTERLATTPPGELRTLLNDLRADDPDVSLFGSATTALETSYPFLKSTPPFMEGMAEQVAEMMDRLGKGTITPEQEERVIQAVAEFAVVRSIMQIVCITPHPTHGGPQDGAWEAHVAFHNAMTPVVQKADPYSEEEEEREEESDSECD